jgi:hypothetical protein
MVLKCPANIGCQVIKATVKYLLAIPFLPLSFGIPSHSMEIASQHETQYEHLKRHFESHTFPTENEENSAHGLLGGVKEELDMLKDKTLKLWGIGLFTGDDIWSAAIRNITESSWSHVALVLEDQTGDKYCFESTGSLEQIIKEKMLPQVQITRWPTKCEKYSGVIATRELAFTKEGLNDPKAIGFIVRSLLGKPYKRSLQTLINAATGSNATDDLSSMFCSELVAEVLKSLGCLNSGVSSKRSSNYLPKDFCMEMESTLNCNLISTQIGPEVMVKNQKNDSRTVITETIVTDTHDNAGTVVAEVIVTDQNNSFWPSYCNIS